MSAALIAVVAWHLARAYVLGSIDPHLRLYAWLEGAFDQSLRPLGIVAWVGLWIIWPVVAWRYCNDNPQEKHERSFALWVEL